ncbi:Aste57867_982 [Aphanomyces stellatus]|uniref:Aste57867_982 protein n=1 Tax=Aphanomyces stellatus TaxID=120398 RepID=A0A485K853_9STRA|nr:hypothetical protein As57867_000981 [Aphanomyces stellatus]VFT78204.1 Aste57867_982 [Aphanomyces stellatus]
MLPPTSPSTASSTSSWSTDAERKGIAPFLHTLRTILLEENPLVFRWTCDGLAFEILDMGQFTTTILPKYFKHQKYSSFQRQLNYFHFKKWTKRRAKVCTFSNAFFTRDQPALANHITRKRTLHHDDHNPTTPAMPRSPTEVDSTQIWGDFDWLLDFDQVDLCLPHVPVPASTEMWV